jgi:protein-disulfide isomerase-like protein with CxxC motif
MQQLVKSRHLAPLVKQHADALRPRWRVVTDAAQEFIPRLLAFAVAYRHAYQDVREQLGTEAVKQLNASIGLTDTAASRLRDIAEARKRESKTSRADCYA